MLDLAALPTEALLEVAELLKARRLMLRSDARRAGSLDPIVARVRDELIAAARETGTFRPPVARTKEKP